MRIVFEIAKLLFFLAVIFVVILKVKGGEFFDAQYAEEMIRMLFPLFFVLGGVVFGWIIAVYFSDSIEPDKQTLMKGFVIGIILGGVAAVLYSVYGVNHQEKNIIEDRLSILYLHQEGTIV